MSLFRNLDKFYYPRTSEGIYFDYSDGVPIDEGRINIWILQAFNKIAQDIKETSDLDKYFHTISSGNTKVLVEAYRERGNKFNIYVSVCTAYQQQTKSGIEF